MKSTWFMIILQSIWCVTPFPLRKTSVSSRRFAIPRTGSADESITSDVSLLETDYVERFTNVARLYENDVNTTLLTFRNAHICVVGLGGVGSWCVEALARSGISRFTLIDMDDICISNTNRQIQALTSTVGQFKGEALRNRILDINPYASVEVLLDFLRPTNVDVIVASNIIKALPTSALTEPNAENDANMLEGNDNAAASETDIEDMDVPYYLSGPPKFDFLIDAADGVTDKAFMIDACVRSGTPVVVCGGAGGLIDPTLLRISDLTKVVGDNLIMHVRKKLRQKFGYPQGQQMSAASKLKGSDGKKQKAVKKWNIPTIHTMPTGVKRGIPLEPASAGNFRKCDVAFGNSCFSTGTVGFLMASVVVNSLAGEKKGSKIPTALGTVGRNRGKVPVKSSVHKGTGGEEDMSKSEKADVAGTSTAENGGEDSSDCGCGVPAEKVMADQEGDVDRKTAIAAVMSNTSQISTVLVDAHCHLQLDPLYSRVEDVIATAKSNHISFAVVCGTCPGDDWDRTRSLYERHPDFIAPQFGLHPWWISRHYESVQQISSAVIEGKGSPSPVPEVNTVIADERKVTGRASWEEELELLLQAIPSAGVGECGLDKGLKNVAMGVQVDILRTHIRIASRHNRPVTIHCVGAWAILLEVLRDVDRDVRKGLKSGALEVGGSGTSVPAYVLHSCNSMPVQMAADFLKIPNVYFSFSGRAMSGNKEGRLAGKVPLERILVETDSPDQLPVHLRTQVQFNEPCLVRLNVEALAGLMALDPNALAVATVANTRRIFQSPCDSVSKAHSSEIPASFPR